MKRRSSKPIDETDLNTLGSPDVQRSLYEWFQRLLLLFPFLKPKHPLGVDKSKELETQLEALVDEFEMYRDFRSGYFNQKKALIWDQKAADVLQKASELSKTFNFPPELTKKLKGFKIYRVNARQRIAPSNNDFVNHELIEYKKFFDKSGSNPLDEDQRRAVICDEDNTLVLAGAGSGKTAVIAAKVGYLVKCKKVDPGDILLLTFGKKAAEEMKRRVKDWYGIEDVECRTIHSLGYQIITRGSKKKPQMLETDDAPTRNSQGFLDLEIFKDLYQKNREFYEGVIHYFSGYLKPYVPQYAFETKKEWDEYVAELGELYTLSNDKVKSLEEKVIANFLFRKGVKFEYEKPYEIPTETQEKRQYKPDFYLTDYGIYLEHFGVDKKGNPPPFFTEEQKKEYIEGMKWKVLLHQTNKTKLICTYSHQQADGILETELEKMLQNEGVLFSDQPVDMDKLIRKSDINQFLKIILRRFTDLFKTSGLSFEDLTVKAQEGPEVYKLRRLAFLKIFKIFYNSYQNTIEAEGKIDFGDMLNKSHDFVVQVFPELDLKFRYIIVDEFQDTAQGAIKLIRTIGDKNDDCRLFFVGDDWQSIYRFNGSDVGMIQNFETRFPNNKVVEIGVNYRSYPNVVDLGKKFIEKNHHQRSKMVRSFHQTRLKNLILWVHSLSVVNKFIETIDKFEKGKGASVYFLGRYNEDVPEYLAELKKTFKSLKIEYMTIHKSKGLEADYVFIIPPKRNSFPSVIEDDPVLDLVAAPRESYLHAEERRLMYVAITRARKQVFFIRPGQEKQKTFIKEIEEMVENKGNSGVRVGGDVKRTNRENRI